MKRLREANECAPTGTQQGNDGAGISTPIRASSLRCSPPLHRALVWKEEGSCAFPWRAPQPTKSLCLLITTLLVLVLGLQAVIETTPVIPMLLQVAWLITP